MKINNLKHLFKSNKIIILIFLLGLLIRLLNPFYGSPVLYVSGDEPPNYMGALFMILNKDPFVRTSIYPPLGSYIQIPFLLISFVILFITGTVHTLTELQIFMISNQGYFLFIPRLISGILGGITILIIYKISLYLFPKKSIALLSAFLFAFSFNHGQISNSGRPWSPAVFFFALSILYVLKSILESNKKLLNSILSGVFCGLSFGFHQIGVFAILFIIFIKFYINKYSLKNFIEDKTVRISLLYAFVFISIFQLLRIYAPTTEWFAVNTSYTNIFSKFINLILYNNLFYNLKQLVITEPIIIVLFFLSIFNNNNWKKHRKPVLLFILVSLLILGISFVMPRYLIPLIMVMCIYASSEFIYLLNKVDKHIKYLLFLIVICFSSLNLLMWSYIYIQKPTFVSAIEWINSHIDKNEVIITTASRFLPYIPSKDVLYIQQTIHPKFNEAIGRLLSYGEYPYNVRNIIYLNEVGDITHKENVPQILNNIPISYNYIIDIYNNPDDTPLKYINKNSMEKVYSQTPFKNKEVKISFDHLLSTIDSPLLQKLLFMINKTGPYIDIYKIKS